MTRTQRNVARYKLTLVVGSLLYVAISASTLLLARTGAQTEIFPLFAWDLFSVVPNARTEYGILVDALDGRPLDPPMPLEELTEAGLHYSMYAYQLAQELAAAQAAGDSKRATAITQTLRTNHLGGTVRNARFHLVRRRYDVLERLRSTAYQQAPPRSTPRRGGRP